MPSVRTLIERGARRHSGEVYLVEAATGATLTYDRLAADVQRVAGVLARAGVGPGDRVGTMLGNTLNGARLMLGAWGAGFVVVPVDPCSPAAEIETLCGRAGVALLCAARAAEARLRSTRLVDRVLWDDALDEERHVQGARPDVPGGADDALLMYTSGTTGDRKVVRLSHRNLLAGAANTARAHALRPGDRGLCVLPLHHINAVVVTLLAPLLSGGSVVLAPGFDAAAFWRWIGGHRCTWFSAVPAQLAAALAAAEGSPAEAFAAACGLRFGRTASAPLPPALHQRFESRFGVPLVETMGLTESAATVFANPLPPGRRKPGSVVGVAVGVRVRVVDASGAIAAPGEAGEIEIRGRSVMRGYLDDAEADAAVLDPEGWLRTGDVGLVDNDGYVFVTGRSKEMVNRGGERIAPREIDNVMAACRGVRQAVCFGVPHPTLGEDLVVAVVAEPDAALGEEALRQHAARHLGRARLPGRFVFVDAIPAGPSGKPQRLRLRERFAAEPESQPYEAPRDRIERLVAGAFSEVLGRERTGRRDHLFALGGDSLAAARIAARLSDAFGVPVPPSMVLGAATVLELADRLRQRV